MIDSSAKIELNLSFDKFFLGSDEQVERKIVKKIVNPKKT